MRALLAILAVVVISIQPVIAESEARVRSNDPALETYNILFKAYTKTTHYNKQYITTVLKYLEFLTEHGNYIKKSDIEIAQEIEDYIIQAHDMKSEDMLKIYFARGIIHRRLVQEKQYQLYFDRAMNLAKEIISNQNEFADFLLKLGHAIGIYSGDSHPLKYFTAARAIYSKTQNSKKLAETNYWIGKYYFNRGKNRKSLQFLEQSVTTFQKENSTSKSLIENYRMLIKAYERIKKRDLATPYCQAMGKLLSENNKNSLNLIYYIHPKWNSLDISRTIKSGKVTLSYTVTKEGKVTNIKFFSGNERLFRKAAWAIKHFRYSTQFNNGHPINTHEVKYTFKLKVI